VVDLDAEMVKNEKKIAFAKMGIEKIQKQIEIPTYVEKTPETVRQRNDEKVCSCLTSWSLAETNVILTKANKNTNKNKNKNKNVVDVL
jgi:Valyl tRNA synthetase tRNA binding arm